jgi:hypothetical protein
MVTARRAALALAAACGAACTDFEDPETVVDMRIIGMLAEPPEIVVPYNPDDPTAVDLAAVAPIEVCALVADPADDRGLHYSMAMCRPTNSGRCIDVGPVVVLGGGQVEDPETAAEPVRMCTTIEPTADLVAVIEESIDADSLGGFGGVQVQVELRVSPDGGGEELFAFKRVRYSPQLPAERVANANPTVSSLIVLRGAGDERGRDFPLPLGRCGEIEPFIVLPDERIQILPEEPAGVREEYLVPTFEGGSRRFTENLTYQWHSTEGDWSPFTSGGTIDVAGNEPPLDSVWRAPGDPEVVGDVLDVRMWIVQRDERGGQAWYESCARVLP